MKNLDAMVSRLQRAYCKAVYDRDVAAFMALYDPGVRVFDAWATWEYEGADAWSSAVKGWFSSLRDERVNATFDATRSVGAEEAFVTSSTVTYAGLSATGEPLRSMQNRMTWGVCITDGFPRVVHEHTSAPIGFENMKAILQKKTSM
jgi:ketosteroid isomerase-like protein